MFLRNSTPLLTNQTPIMIFLNTSMLTRLLFQLKTDTTIRMENSRRMSRSNLSSTRSGTISLNTLRKCTKTPNTFTTFTPTSKTGTGSFWSDSSTISERSSFPKSSADSPNGQSLVISSLLDANTTKTASSLIMDSKAKTPTPKTPC